MTTHEAYLAAIAADEAYSTAIKNVFGERADRWVITHRTQMTHPALKSAYEAKIAADQLCHDLAEADHNAAKSTCEHLHTITERWGSHCEDCGSNMG